MAEFQQCRLKFLVPGDHAAHPGTAGGEPLGHGVHDHQILVDIPEPSHGGHAEFVVVADLPVDLVADEEQIVFLGNVRNHPHFRLVQHHAGGVARIGNEDCPGVGGNEALDPLPIGVAVALPGIGGQCPDDAAGGVNEGGVVGVIRLGDDDLGVGIQNGQAGEEKCLAAAGGHQDVVVLQGHPQGAVVVPDGLNQLRPSGRGLIGQGFVRKSVHRLVKFRGRGNVRLSDVQVINFLPGPFRLDGQRMEFAHGRGFTTVCVYGNLHTYLHRQLPDAPDFYILS